MSGIAGFLDWGRPDEAPRQLRAMLHAMRARATAGYAEWHRGGVALGAAPGPWGPDETAGGAARRGAWTLVLAGVLLNRRPLAAELAARGRIPEGGEDVGDADLLVAMVEELGFVKALGRVEGEVAVAAWDGAELWLGVDPVGLRPLHLAKHAGGVAFATDLGALGALPGFHATVSSAATALLSAGALQLDPLALFKEAERLPPGAVARVRAGAVELLRTPPPPLHPSGWGGSRPRWARSLGYGLELATRRRLPPAGPLVVALSGGRFSAGVAEVLAGLKKGEVRALTLAGPGAVDAHAVADRLGIPLDEVGLDTTAVQRCWDAAGDGGPALADPDAPALTALATRAWELDATALFVGTGGELWTPPALPTAGRLWRQLRPAALAARPGPSPDRAGLAAALGLPTDTPLPEHLLPELAAARGDAPLSADQQALWLARRVRLPGRRLPLLDAVSAVAGLPVLAPLCDARLLAVLAEVPLEHLRPGGVPGALFDLAVQVGVRGRADAPPPPRTGGTLAAPLRAWLEEADAVEAAARVERLVDAAWWEHTRAAARGGDEAAAGRAWALQVLGRWAWPAG